MHTDIYRLKSSSFVTSFSRSLTYAALISTSAHLHVGGFEGEFFEQPLEDRVQPAGADVLRGLVHLVGESASASMASSVNSSVDAFGLQQRRVLLGERVLRLGEDADEVVLGQVLQLDADREAALQLGHQVARLGACGTRRRR